MPFCKNDPLKKYIGNEPSPKGLGYCAHTEPLYKVMEGKDSYYQYNGPTINNSKKWKRLNIPASFFNKIKNINIKMKNNIIITKIKKGKWINDIIVHYKGPTDVYRNKDFEKAINKITKCKFTFSEQGMQQPYKAHMEINNKELIKLVKLCSSSI